MSTPLLEHVRELIMQRRYDEARRILETIDHPTAQKWLAKLDEISPPVEPIKGQSHAPKSQNRIWVIALALIAIVAFAGSVSVIALFAPRLATIVGSVLPTEGPSERERETLIIYCMSEDETLGRTECSDVADFISGDLELWGIASTCLDNHIDNLPAFTICMRDVLTALEDRLELTSNQRSMLFDYCSDTQGTSSGLDMECFQWASDTSALFSEPQAMAQCWNLDNLREANYWNSANVYSVDSESGRERLHTVVTCIRQFLAEDMPDLPPCVPEFNTRATCDNAQQ